ncbi:MAG TPA: NAD(P)-binding domain-containing protein [Actinomycetota bacterium]|nr:NAD(P)-binding domain-containing protein [Actinomycetota bacterium]
MDERRLSPTRIGVIGSGEVGKRFSSAFASLGHDVIIGAREPERDDLRRWHETQTGALRAGTYEEAATHGDLVILAVLGIAVAEAIEQARPANLAGKVLIDATNPLDFSEGFPPKLAWGHTDSGGERVQRAAPKARVVKAFNIIGNPYFVNPRFHEGQPTMFIAGSDEEAKALVADVLHDFGWPPPIDCGDIEGARYLEPLAILWVRIIGTRGASDHAFKLLTDAEGEAE